MYVHEYPYTPAGTEPSGTPTTTSFTYNTSKPDVLTKFGNKSVGANSNGALTSYIRNYTWSNGKLSKFMRGSKMMPGGIYEECNYTYNGYGQRISKTYAYDPNPAVSNDASFNYTKTYKYDHSGRLINEKIVESHNLNGNSTREFVYLYDESSMVGFTYSLNGTTPQAYYYQRNLFGDVIGIYNTNGAKIVEYAYDAWGNCTTVYSSNDTLANDNPIRYRGYYSDIENNFYYLNSRYYSPELRRFISPDDTAYLDPESVNGLNLYCYCNNDPVNFVDPSGHLAFWIITALIGAAIGVGITAIVDYIPDQEFNLHWGWYVGAGVAGALIGAGIGMAISYSATGTFTASFTDIRFGYALKAAQNGNYNKLAKFGTHNNRSKQVGLGKYIEGSPNSYEVLSRKFGYTYYELKPKYWHKMSNVLNENVWNVNKAFLDQQLSLGKTFVQLSTDYRGYYLRELIHLGLL